MEPASADQRFIKSLSEIILENLGNEDFCVNDLAREAGVSLYLLSKGLHRITGKTISQFIREIRLTRALEMLQSERLTASEVAYKVGFSSPTYFNTCFHEFYGYPPGKVKSVDREVGYAEISKISEIIKLIRSSRKSLLIVAATIVILAGLSSLLFFHFPGGGPSDISDFPKRFGKSLAVLPFTKLDNNSEDQYFIDGVMEEILNDLTSIGGLRVVSRTTVEQFRENTFSASEIAKKLNVAYLLEGSGQKYGNNFRLRIRLIDAINDRQIWADSYEQVINGPDDIFSLQNQIAKKIATELKVNITPEEKNQIEKVPTKSLTAYDFYERGKDEQNKLGFYGFDPVVLKKAEHLYHKALEYDSTFARAYVGLAYILWTKWYRENPVPGNKELNTCLDSMLILADIALSYDHHLAHAYIVKGEYYAVKGDISRTIEEYNNAIRYEPNDGGAYLMLAGIYEELDILKSLQIFETAIQYNHGQELIYVLLRLGYNFYQAGFPDKGNYYLLQILSLDGDTTKYNDYLMRFRADTQGDYTDVIRYFEKRFSTDSTNTTVLVLLGYYYSLAGKYDESLKYYKKYIEVKKSTKTDVLMNQYTRLGFAFLMNGYKSEAGYYFNRQVESYTRRLTSLRPGERIYWTYPLAGVYACQGDKAKAIENLKIFNKNPSFTLSWVNLIKSDPQFDNLREDREFKSIVRDVESKYLSEHEKVRKWLMYRQDIN
jgi:TolB-like protein/AraC-like DNA-binding protein/Tfp pilus assembly protein PilF